MQDATAPRINLTGANGKRKPSHPKRRNLLRGENQKMNISKKVLIILLALAIIITAITMAAVFVPAVGKWFSTTFGGAGAGLVNLAQIPLKFALEGGAQTFALYGIGLLVLFGFAYWVWHWDIGYKFTGANQNAGDGNYQSTPSQNIIPLENNLQSEPTKKE